MKSAASTWTERLDPKPFLAAMPPLKDVRRPTASELDLGDGLPGTLRHFLDDVGFGRFSDGFLRIQPPRALEPLLAEWLGGSKPTRIPFATTALGDILYFRDLRDRGEGVNDIFVVDVRYKRTTMVAHDIMELVATLSEPIMLIETLAKDLFDAALPRLGPPDVDEIYGFVPALALGGSPDPANLERLKADVHLSILFQC